MRIPFILFLCATLMVGGCATRQSVPPRDGLTQRSGLIHFNEDGKSVVADFVVNQTGDFCSVQISKGPSLVLINVQTVDGKPGWVRVSGPLARGGWRGTTQNAPTHLKAFARLPAILLSESGRAKREMTIQEGDTRLVYQLSP